MSEIQKRPIDPHLRERRERIATAVLAELVGTEKEFRPQQCTVALQAADALIDALDSESV